MTVAQLQYFTEIVWNVFFFMFGACVGSFLNVCILRIPKGESLVKPPSHCACGAPIKWYNNIPILSWFILRGKAPCCGRRFSFRYAFVEILTACLFLLCRLHFSDYATGYVFMFFCCIMLVAAFIDIDTMYLPDFLTAGGAFTGLILSIIFPQIHNLTLSGIFAVDAFKGAIISVIGMTVGAGSVAIIRYFSQIVLGKEAMGEGDVILAIAIGAFCGWQGALFALFGGSVIGAILLMPMYPFIKHKAKTNEGLAVPFGPWLALGALLYVLWLNPYVIDYFDGVKKLLCM